MFPDAPAAAQEGFFFLSLPPLKENSQDGEDAEAQQPLSCSFVRYALVS